MAAIGCLVSLATACAPPSTRSLTTVTGKVVYGTMAIEGAELKTYRMENGTWEMTDESQSGYHGSFRLHLAKGTYRIKASTTMRVGEDLRELFGDLEPLTVEGGKGRMDQVVIKLKAVPSTSSGQASE